MLYAATRTQCIKVSFGSIHTCKIRSVVNGLCNQTFFFMKLFKINNLDIVKTCQQHLTPSTPCTKRSVSFDNKFLNSQNFFLQNHTVLYLICLSTTYYVYCTDHNDMNSSQFFFAFSLLSIFWLLHFKLVNKDLYKGAHAWNRNISKTTSSGASQ